MIPVRYNIRNLRVRWITTLMTVIGTGLVVWASVLSFGLSDGLRYALQVTGDAQDLIVLRKGSNNETASGIQQDVARSIATLPGIATLSSPVTTTDGAEPIAAGTPMCSVEFVTILTKPRRNNGGTTNLIVRGLERIGRQLRPGFVIAEGRDIIPGRNEVITSRRMAQRFENLSLGEKLEINKVEFTVVGYFEAAGSAAESEVWTDINDITTARRTPSVATSVNLRVADGVDPKTLIEQLANDKRFSLTAIPETKYFEDQMSASIAIQIIGYIIAFFLTVGAMFAAANTMFAAVASRGREIGTLRAIGFPRESILASFLLESTILCVLGGILGCLATLPFNGLTTGTANWASFSEITFSFRFGPRVLAQGLILALSMGILGGLLPAIRAVRMNIVSALRDR